MLQQIKLKKQKKIKFKQSAAETLCFIRYFGIIMRDIVPEGDEHWELYLILKNIVKILTSPKIIENNIYYMENLVRKHNTFYLKLFGELKPNAIFTHYSLLMRDFGPLVHL